MIIGWGFLDIGNVVFLVLLFRQSTCIFLHLIVSWNDFISICVLFCVVRKCYMDISDCQFSGVGLGMIKWVMITKHLL